MNRAPNLHQVHSGLACTRRIAATRVGIGTSIGDRRRALSTELSEDWPAAAAELTWHCETPYALALAVQSFLTYREPNLCGGTK